VPADLLAHTNVREGEGEEGRQKFFLKKKKKNMK
jgi:hypothetical protein